MSHTQETKTEPSEARCLLQVIAVAGRNGSGKTWSADFLARTLGGLRESFARPLKEWLAILGLPRAKLFGSNADKEALLPEFGVSCRTAMIALGMQVRSLMASKGSALDNLLARRMQHRLLGLLAEAKSGSDAGHPTVVVVDDLRFENELAALRSLTRDPAVRLITLRIDRGFALEDGEVESAHIANTATDDWSFDVRLTNDKSDTFIRQLQALADTLSVSTLREAAQADGPGLSKGSKLDRIADLFGFDVASEERKARRDEFWGVSALEFQQAVVDAIEATAVSGGVPLLAGTWVSPPEEWGPTSSASQSESKSDAPTPSERPAGTFQSTVPNMFDKTPRCGSPSCRCVSCAARRAWWADVKLCGLQSLAAGIAAANGRQLDRLFSGRRSIGVREAVGTTAGYGALMFVSIFVLRGGTALLGRVATAVRGRFV